MIQGRTGLLGTVALVIGAVLVGLGLFELGSRWLLERTPAGEDVLLGVVLPPRSVIPSPAPKVVDRDTPYEGLVIDGVAITTSDLWGIMRPDPLVGYVPQENSVSTHGWWRSNDVGARYDRDLGKGVGMAPVGQRWLFFGESFTQGSRLPQEDTWTYRLDTLNADIEAVNFGVDGYGMAQSLLRYRTVADRVRHDVAAFVFLPTADLWREVNTVRSLAEPWHSFAVLPRFYLAGSDMRLVRSPYPDIDTLYGENYPRITDKLRNHLQQYDSFFVPALYDPARADGRLVSARLVRAFQGKRRLKEIRRQTFYDPESEAWRTVRQIFLQAKIEAQDRGADFVLIVMPTHDDVRTAADYDSFRDYWTEMVAVLRNEGLRTFDLLPELSAVEGDLDYGYDGSHYGPRASARIAAILNDRLLH